MDRVLVLSRVESAKMNLVYLLFIAKSPKMDLV